MAKKTWIIGILLTVWFTTVVYALNDTPEKMYDQMQRQLAQGWNTWDTRSVLTHVYLPYAFAIDLNLMDAHQQRIDKFLIGERGEDAPLLHPGPHSFDGTYTSISVKWHGMEFTVESAAEKEKNVILITPSEGSNPNGTLVIAPKTIWMRGNTLTYDSLSFVMYPNNQALIVRGKVIGSSVIRKGNEYHVSLNAPIVVCCGTEMSVGEAQSYIKQRADEFMGVNRQRFGIHYDCYNAMQSVLGWDNIYDPTIRKVITPVSRIWSSTWFASTDFGGFTLFCWDTYFASMMLAAGNKELAYANAVEITKSITETGFVPNCFFSNGFKSRDRSQPPVGSLAVWTIYQQYREKWFLELLYNELLSWNRWWIKNREDKGLLCQGSNRYDNVTYFRSEYSMHCRYGAILESGLDNSPMYDDVDFDAKKSLLQLNDVGLSSLYVMDCDYLALIAQELGKTDDAQELRQRADVYRNRLSELWDNQTGFYYNRSTVDMKLNRRTSPTNFYPLLAKAPDTKQARRMIQEHLLNPDEFWGEYIIPSTPHNDPAYSDNEYWRGRIWGPLNFLVYMGLRNYDFPKVRCEFAEKSKNLLMKSWLSHGYIFENYNADTGIGDDVTRSDKFYHWGALLGYISLIENGVINGL